MPRPPCSVLHHSVDPTKDEKFQTLGTVLPHKASYWGRKVATPSLCLLSTLGNGDSSLTSISLSTYFSCSFPPHPTHYSSWATHGNFTLENQGRNWSSWDITCPSQPTVITLFSMDVIFSLSHSQSHLGMYRSETFLFISNNTHIPLKAAWYFGFWFYV